MISYAQYLYGFTREGIKKWIDTAHYHGVIPASVTERINKMLDIAAENKNVHVERGISTNMLDQTVIYELFRLDRQKFFLVPGARNTAINGPTLLNALCSFDPEMAHIDSLDILQQLTTVMTCVAVLYCHAMGKHVEIKTLLMLPSDRTKTSLLGTLKAAQEMLVDCRHFSKNTFDTRVVTYMNASRRAVSNVKPMRAF